MRKPPPSVWDFVDYREYLQLYLSYKREGAAGFSVRQFCLKAGITTENYLLRIIRGERRLGHTIAERLIEVLPLKGREAEYFRALVAFGMAKSPAEQSQVLARMESLRRKTNRCAPVTDHSILRHWYLGTVLELAWCPDFELTPERVVKAVGGRLSIQQAKEAIAFLQAKGYLVERDGKQTPANIMITTSDERTDALLSMSHKEHLAEAIQAVDRPIEERGFYGLTIAVHQDRLPEVKGRLKKFMDELQADLALDPRANTVYRINSNVFSLAKATK